MNAVNAMSAVIVLRPALELPANTGVVVFCLMVFPVFLVLVERIGSLALFSVKIYWFDVRLYLLFGK